MKVVYDAGALIALDKGDFTMRKYHARLNELGIVPVVPAGVIAQAWRGGTQARMSQVLRNADHVDLTFREARKVGELLGKTATSDLVDASCVRAAAPVGVVVTSDPGDMRKIIDSEPEFAIEIQEI